MPDHEKSDPLQWVDLYGDFLYRFALARINDVSVAEDLVQETFLAALSAHKTFKGYSSEKTWILGILKHKIIDYLRKKNREIPSENLEKLAQSAELQFDPKGRWKFQPAKWAGNPSILFEQREFLNTLYFCMSKLPERPAKAFLLRELKGFSADELCQKMSITANNSWVLLYRARMFLRSCIEDHWLGADQER